MAMAYRDRARRLLQRRSGLGAIPPGFTQGTGANIGSFYYDGHRVQGLTSKGDAAILDDGRVIPAPGLADELPAAQQQVADYYESLKPHTAEDFANGVLAYGQMWKAGTQPPAGLDAAGVDNYTRNSGAVGYAPFIWDAMRDSVTARATMDEFNAAVQAGTLTDEQGQAASDAQDVLHGIWDPIVANAKPAPEKPKGPARYLAGGIDFWEDGRVNSVDGRAVPDGTVLTSDEMQRLLNGGALTADEKASIAPPASAPSPGYVAQPVASAPSQGITFSDANGGGTVNPQPSNPNLILPTDNSFGPSGMVGGSEGAQAVAGMGSTVSPLLLLAGLGAAVLLMRKKHS